MESRTEEVGEHPGRGACSRIRENQWIRDIIPEDEWLFVTSYEEQAKRKYPEPVVRDWLARWKRSARGLDAFCQDNDDLPSVETTRKMFKVWTPEEYAEAVITMKSKGTKSGTRFEQRVNNLLKSLGWFSLRSPASRGAADVIALKAGRIALIQCKLTRTKISPQEKRELIAAAQQAGGVPVLSWRGARGKGPQWENLLTGERWSP